MLIYRPGADGNLKTGAMGSDNTFPLIWIIRLDNIAVYSKWQTSAYSAKSYGKKYTNYRGISAQDWKLKMDSADGKKVSDTAQKENAADDGVCSKSRSNFRISH